MKKIILLLIISCLSLFSYAQTPGNYKGFKTGKFTYQAGKEKVFIKRTKHKQIETLNHGKSKIVMKIKWVDENSFILTMKKIVNLPGCLNILSFQLLE